MKLNEKKKKKKKKYGQVFEGRAGGIDRPVEGAHTGGFNRDTWGVAMLGNFDQVAPTQIQLRNTGRLLGWRLGLDHIDPRARWCSPRPAARSPSSRSAPPRRCRPSSPTVTWASPNARATPHMPRWVRSGISQHDSTGHPVLPTWRRRCAAARSSRNGSRWAARTASSADRGHPRRRARAARYVNFERARCTGRRQWRRTGHRRDLQSVGRRWASSAARSACRPAARSRSRSGSCRTSSTAR